MLAWVNYMTLRFSLVSELVVNWCHSVKLT